MRSPRSAHALACALAIAGRLLVAGAPAGAQPASIRADGSTAGVSVSLASLWDDETHLGRGPAVAAEASVPLGAHVRAGVEAGWFGHDRDSGYLAADGDVLHVMGRASLLIGPARWSARPFIGGGLGVARSSGTFTTRDPFVVPHERRQAWQVTGGAWDLHLGVRATAGNRWAIRPEVRAGVIGSAGSSAGLQTPLLRLQGGVAVEWAGR